MYTHKLKRQERLLMLRDQAIKYKKTGSVALVLKITRFGGNGKRSLL